MTRSVHAYFTFPDRRVSLFLYYYVPKWILNIAQAVCRSACSLPFLQMPLLTRVVRFLPLALNGTGRPVLAWYTADVEDLARVDTDHNGTDNGVAREPVQPSQVPDAAL